MEYKEMENKERIVFTIDLNDISSWDAKMRIRRIIENLRKNYLMEKHWDNINMRIVPKKEDQSVISEVEIVTEDLNYFANKIWEALNVRIVPKKEGIKVGDVVILKSGSPLMTVSNTVDYHPKVAVTFFDGADACDKVFPVDSLMKLTKEQFERLYSEL